MAMDVKKGIAVVTGANRGIGRELVRALLAAGVKKVYATARDINSLDATLELDPSRVVALQLDVTNHQRVASLPSEASDANLLINNAGVLDFGSMLEVPLESVKRNIETNFYGKLLMARAFAPVIERNGGGAIVNILSLVSLASMPGLSGYNASKAAAWSMTLSMRASLAGKGIAVHGVFPAGVDTDMLAGVDAPKASPVEVAKAIVSGIAMNQEDIFPDAMSTQVYAAWRQDHKAVEKQFAAM
jgi:NAD(P)-dependent dehydrogenase (short-subunit alcohol dehydrogenase family)